MLIAIKHTNKIKDEFFICKASKLQLHFLTLVYHTITEVIYKQSQDKCHALLGNYGEYLETLISPVISACD